ncbi:class I SAM-dependent methyltransferase [Immundisolibacter sp.]|uniref:class I SAM-dependent methyltransferase n=1 Tax=Immundisolibacter sp. TaxID=1934948 RepID=UPI00356B09C2
MTQSLLPQLPFSDKYDLAHAHAYQQKHHTGLRRRLTTWRETQLARRALKLAGNPESVLDMPCGAGRFWPMLAAHPTRRLLAGDRSPAMLEIARGGAQPAVLSRVESLLPLDAFRLSLPDDAVEHVLCMRLLHHIESAADRLRILSEIHRVGRLGATVSLWVDGNIQSRRRNRQDTRRTRANINRLVVPRATIEAEFAQVGFRVRRRLDVCPGLSMWRLYLLDKA